MAKYVLKRKQYGIMDAAKNTIGGVVGGVGNALDTKVGGAAAGIATGAALGGKIASGLGALGVLSGPVGWLAAAGIGAMAARGLGKGLKNAGTSMQM